MKTFKEFISEDQVDEGLASLIVKGTKAVAPIARRVAGRVGSAVRTVVNDVRYGRTPVRNQQVDAKYAERFIDPKEAGVVRRTGHLLPDPVKPRKNFTPSNNDTGISQGAFGNSSFAKPGYRSDITLTRTPANRVPTNRPVKARDMQMWDREGGSWVPFKEEVE